MDNDLSMAKEGDLKNKVAKRQLNSNWLLKTSEVKQVAKRQSNLNR